MTNLRLLQRERQRLDAKNKSKINSKLAHIYHGMKRRCCNASDKGYRNYGGRGIRVCEDWLTFDGFKKDMALGYRLGMSLDRRDPNRNYCKSNCRWIPREMQGYTTRGTIMYYQEMLLTYDGATMNALEWAEYLDVEPKIIARAIKAIDTIGILCARKTKQEDAECFDERKRKRVYVVELLSKLGLSSKYIVSTRH